MAGLNSGGSSCCCSYKAALDRCSSVGVRRQGEVARDRFHGALLYVGQEAQAQRLTSALRRADRPLRTMKRCEDKIRYGTAAGAKWSLWGIWLDRYLRGRRRRRERRAYACPHCGGWHLTSQPKRRR